MSFAWLAEHWSISFAVITTGVAVVSGLFGITKANLWDQADGIKAYAQGDIGAWLYLLMCGSTIISMAHLGLLVDWAWRDGRTILGGGWTDPWNVWHGTSSIFLSLVHYIIIRFRVLRLARPDKDNLIQDLW